MLLNLLHENSLVVLGGLLRVLVHLVVVLILAVEVLLIVVHLVVVIARVVGLDRDALLLDTRKKKSAKI